MNDINTTYMLICDHCRKPASQLDLTWVGDKCMKLCPTCKPKRPIANKDDLPLVHHNDP